MPPFWLGLALGLGLGLLNAAASIGLAWLGLRQRPTVFLGVVLGGLVARMMVLLVVVLVVLRFLPVDPLTFIGGLFGSFVVGLLVEMIVLWRRPGQGASPRAT